MSLIISRFYRILSTNYTNFTKVLQRRTRGIQLKKPNNKNPQKIELIHEGDVNAYSEDGIDLTMIRWMLSLSPTERLKHLQQTINAITRIQHEASRK
jgi:hypothetical protein